MAEVLVGAEDPAASGEEVDGMISMCTSGSKLASVSDSSSGRMVYHSSGQFHTERKGSSSRLTMYVGPVPSVMTNLRQLSSYTAPKEVADGADDEDGAGGASEVDGGAGVDDEGTVSMGAGHASSHTTHDIKYDGSIPPFSDRPGKDISSARPVKRPAQKRPVKHSWRRPSPKKSKANRLCDEVGAIGQRLDSETDKCVC